LSILSKVSIMDNHRGNSCEDQGLSWMQHD
jgi:hypothetical protein